MTERCPTCGALVRVNSSGEGTHWYEPVKEQPAQLRYSERIMYDRAATVSARPGAHGLLAAALAEDLLVLLERIGRMRDKPSRALEDTQPTRETGS